jgi:hypothetical protein
MPPEGFEPTIPASVWPQTHSSSHAATGIGLVSILRPYTSQPCSPMFNHGPLFSQTICALTAVLDKMQMLL